MSRREFRAFERRLSALEEAHESDPLAEVDTAGGAYAVTMRAAEAGDFELAGRAFALCKELATEGGADSP